MARQIAEVKEASLLQRRRNVLAAEPNGPLPLPPAATRCDELQPRGTHVAIRNVARDYAITQADRIEAGTGAHPRS